MNESILCWLLNLFLIHLFMKTIAIYVFYLTNSFFSLPKHGTYIILCFFNKINPIWITIIEIILTTMDCKLGAVPNHVEYLCNVRMYHYCLRKKWKKISLGREKMPKKQMVRSKVHKKNSCNERHFFQYSGCGYSSATSY